MSKIKVKGNDSGTGVITIEAPNTSTDRTIVLPDATGTLATTADTTDLDGAVVINESGADVDFRVESDTNANSIFVQGSNGAVGLGVSSIATNDALHIENGESYLVMKDAQQMGIKLYGDDTNVIYSYDKTADSLTGGVTWAHADGATNFYTGGLNARMTIDSTGAVTMPSQPAFLVKVTSQVNNLAINTTHSIDFGTEIFDQNADFGSNTFTAPVTGRYQLNALLYLKQLDKDTDYNELFIVTSNRTYTNIIAAPAFNADASYWTLALSVLADMDANDTSTIGFSIPNSGSAQIDLAADSYFSGYLVC